jgi:hypothetical protein
MPHLFKSPSNLSAASLGVAGLLLTAGCYGAAPPRPQAVTLPGVAQGSTLEVFSNSSTSFENVQKQSETCPQGHGSGSAACVKTTYTVKEPVTRTVSTATHGGTPIDYAQFLVISDPHYQESLTILADHSEACQEANVPRYIGMGLAIGGLIAYSLGGSKDNGTVANIGLAGLAGGAGSYTAGYFAFGGNRCVAASHLYGQINYAHSSGQTEIRGSVTALEMKTLADKFNQRRTQSASATD